LAKQTRSTTEPIMATSNLHFLPENSATWTAQGMRNHLRTGKLKDTFYREVFGWTNAQFQDAFERANEAVERANIMLTEILSRTMMCIIRIAREGVKGMVIIFLLRRMCGFIGSIRGASHT
jgi:hypothetical protein